MLPIAMGENGCNGERRRRMAGRKACVYTAERFRTAEERVGEIAERRDVGRTQSARRYFHHYVNDGAVGVGFPGEQRGPLRVARGAESPHHQKERGNDGRFCRGDASGEKVVKALESPRAPEVRRVVGVGGDECRRHSRYQERGQPVPSLPELHRKQPDVFLILKNVVRERAPGDVALRSS